MNEELSEAQQMWLDVITSVVQQPRFDINIGDMSYVLGNMVAKFVSSAKFYRITEKALNHLSTACELDVTKPVHIRKHIYGKGKTTLLEHMIPASTIRKAIVANTENESIHHILLNAGRVVVMLRTEDEQLTAAGLRSKMPEEWQGFGDDPSIRYKKAGIVLSETLIIPTGPICR